jgi:positive regulator of sigma E activity
MPARYVTLRIPVPAEVAAGQPVIVGLESGHFVRMVARLYLAPLLVGLVLAFICHHLVGGSWSDRARDLGALAGFLAGVVGIAAWNARAGAAVLDRVRFVRAGGSAETAACGGPPVRNQGP